MACSCVSQLCNNFVISQAVTFTAGTGTTPGTLAINVPAGSYANGCKYCLVIAQDIPTTTTINANVVITIGTDTTTTYPLVNCDGTNVQAAAIATRTKYATRVATNIGSGVFKLLCNINCNCCSCRRNNGTPALPVATTAAAGATGEEAVTEPLPASIKVPVTTTKGGDTKNA